MYAVTVLLNRTERQFWRMTPRKLNALVAAHVEANGGSEEKQNEPKQGFIDQVI